MQTLCHLC